MAVFGICFSALLLTFLTKETKVKGSKILLKHNPGRKLQLTSKATGENEVSQVSTTEFRLQPKFERMFLIAMLNYWIRELRSSEPTYPYASGDKCSPTVLTEPVLV